MRILLVFILAFSALACDKTIHEARRELRPDAGQLPNRPVSPVQG